MLTARFLLIAAPLGYLALTGYLLAQIMPLPIAIMPLASREDERARAPLAALDTPRLRRRLHHWPHSRAEAI